MCIKILTGTLNLFFIQIYKKLFLNQNKIKKNAIKVLQFTFVLKVIMENWHLRWGRKCKVIGKLLKSSLHSVIVALKRVHNEYLSQKKMVFPKLIYFLPLKKHCWLIKFKKIIVEKINKKLLQVIASYTSKLDFLSFNESYK